MSDWSTDSCGWSDEDYGVDLDFTTPPLSVDSGAVDTSDQEIVRCICEVEEENDFMIQVSCWLGLHDSEKTLHCIYIGYIYIWELFDLCLKISCLGEKYCWLLRTCVVKNLSLKLFQFKPIQSSNYWYIDTPTLDKLTLLVFKKPVAAFCTFAL